MARNRLTASIGVATQVGAAADCLQINEVEFWSCASAGNCKDYPVRSIPRIEWKALLGIAGALAAGMVLAIPNPALTLEARQVAAVWILVLTLWLTEFVPLPASALLGASLCVLLGLDDAKSIFKNFADPLIFLFVGSFLIAQAMIRHGLNKRLALAFLGIPLFQGQPVRILAGFGCAAAFLSLWLSNSATTAMMLPIALAIIRATPGQQGRERFGTALLLMAAFGASVGGLGTPVGTPPNLIGLAAIRQHLGVDISFFAWMLMALPIVLVVMLILTLKLSWLGGEKSDAEIESNSIAAEWGEIGRMGRGELSIIIVGVITVLLWLLPIIVGILSGQGSPVAKTIAQRLPEGVVALLGAVALFFLPDGKGGRVLVAEDIGKIDWGTILLFGGGIALGELMFSTGLAGWVGQGLADFFQAQSLVGITVLFVVIAIIVSEMASNTASAIMVIPVAIAVSQAAGVPALQPALGACLGASFGFMLPVSTAPNAIIFSSGHVPLPDMIRQGIILDCVGAVVVSVAVLLWVPFVFTCLGLTAR